MLNTADNNAKVLLVPALYQSVLLHETLGDSFELRSEAAKVTRSVSKLRPADRNKYVLM